MSSASPAPTITRFDPASYRTFRFIGRSLDADGVVRLRYGLDELEFEEAFALPPGFGASAPNPGTVAAILDLLHWVAGVSYYKAAIPPTISFEANAPGPATIQLLTALYSEGLGEFAVVNKLSGLPNPVFETPGQPSADGPAGAWKVAARSHESASEATSHAPDTAPADNAPITSLLVPVGGGKDSAVAIEIARKSGLDVTLFSVGDATPIRETARVAGYERLKLTRTIDPLLIECNAAGALNGHVPITAIVSYAALLTAALNGQDAVTLANERSASAGNLTWHGIDVNHQFSKSRRAERLLSRAVAEIPGAPRIFSILRPASELGIARAFARFGQYHPVFTSCNRVFQIDPAKRTSSWCCDCDKCRFVYLILAPFMTPEQLTAIFGTDLLDDPGQYEGFALLAAAGGDKPFECVGEVEEVKAAISLIAADPGWRGHAVVRRLAAEVLGGRQAGDAELRRHFALADDDGDDHDVPGQLIGAVREVLGA